MIGPRRPYLAQAIGEDGRTIANLALWAFDETTAGAVAGRRLATLWTAMTGRRHPPWRIASTPSVPSPKPGYSRGDPTFQVRIPLRALGRPEESRGRSGESIAALLRSIGQVDPGMAGHEDDEQVMASLGFSEAGGWAVLEASSELYLDVGFPMAKDLLLDAREGTLLAVVGLLGLAWRGRRGTHAQGVSEFLPAREGSATLRAAAAATRDEQALEASAALAGALSDEGLGDAASQVSLEGGAPWT